MNKLNIKAYMFLLAAAFCISGCAGSGSRPGIFLEAKTKETEENADGAQTTCEINDAAADSSTCFVYVCGAVKHPGVFELPQGSRVYEAIALAGGFRKNAYEKGINQAEQIQDGDMIEVLTIKEHKELAQDSQSPAGRRDDGSSIEDALSVQSDEQIDINTASAAQLMTLSGIGEAKADNIIAYRESHGGFSSVEEIKNVSGIGEGVYAKIQDHIKVTN